MNAVTLGLGVNVLVELREADTGQVFWAQRTHNLVTDSGLASIAKAMQGMVSLQITHVAVGTGTATPAAGNTALAAEVSRSRVTQRAQSGGTATVQQFIPSGDTSNGNTLAEAGLFLEDGTMLARVTFTPFAKTAGYTMTITWNVTAEAV